MSSKGERLKETRGQYERCRVKGCKRKAIHNGKCALHDALAVAEIEAATNRTLASKAADALAEQVRRSDEVARALAVLDAKSEREEDRDGWIVAYRWPCGPFHRLLGLQTHISALAATHMRAESALREILSLCDMEAYRNMGFAHLVARVARDGLGEEQGDGH